MLCYIHYILKCLFHRWQLKSYLLLKDLIWESVEYQLNDGHEILATLFINLMTEKFQIINKHLCSTETNLWITASVNGTQASITFHDISYEDSELCHIIFYNQPDIKDHLIYLWTEVWDLL